MSLRVPETASPSIAHPRSFAHGVLNRPGTAGSRAADDQIQKCAQPDQPQRLGKETVAPSDLPIDSTAKSGGCESGMTFDKTAARYAFFRLLA